MHFLFTLFLTLIHLAPLHAENISFESELLFTEESEEKLVDIIKALVEDPHSFLNGEGQTLSLNIDVFPNFFRVRSAKKSITRDYNTPLTAEERNDIVYLLNTMATSSLGSLAKSSSSLKKAGDRIHHIHPLLFLETVFTDEQLKANIHAIKTRHFVWDKLFDGLEESLKEESRKNNLRPDQISRFSATIGVNSSLIAPIIQAKKWKELLNTLIDTIPRSGNTGRYDM